MKLFDLHADIGYDVMEEKTKGDFHVVKNTHAKKFDQGQIGYVAMASFFEGNEDWAYMQDMIKSLRSQIEECEDIDLVLDVYKRQELRKYLFAQGFVMII